MFCVNSATRFQFDVETTVVGNANVSGISTTNTFDSYTANDINFRYNGTYMYCDLSVNQLKFDTVVVIAYSTTCFNLTETSDKRLKENIEEVETECSDLVKKIKVRKYLRRGIT